MGFLFLVFFKKLCDMIWKIMILFINKSKICKIQIDEVDGL